MPPGVRAEFEISGLGDNPLKIMHSRIRQVAGLSGNCDGEELGGNLKSEMRAGLFSACLRQHDLDLIVSALSCIIHRGFSVVSSCVDVCSLGQ